MASRGTESSMSLCRISLNLGTLASWRPSSETCATLILKVYSRGYPAAEF